MWVTRLASVVLFSRNFPAPGSPDAVEPLSQVYAIELAGVDALLTDQSSVDHRARNRARKAGVRPAEDVHVREQGVAGRIGRAGVKAVVGATGYRREGAGRVGDDRVDAVPCRVGRCDRHVRREYRRDDVADHNRPYCDGDGHVRSRLRGDGAGGEWIDEGE